MNYSSFNPAKFLELKGKEN